MKVRVLYTEERTTGTPKETRVYNEFHYLEYTDVISANPEDEKRHALLKSGRRFFEHTDGQIEVTITPVLPGYVKEFITVNEFFVLEPVESGYRLVMKYALSTMASGRMRLEDLTNENYYSDEYKDLLECCA